MNFRNNILISNRLRSGGLPWPARWSPIGWNICCYWPKMTLCVFSLVTFTLTIDVIFVLVAFQKLLLRCIYFFLGRYTLVLYLSLWAPYGGTGKKTSQLLVALRSTRSHIPLLFDFYRTIEGIDWANNTGLNEQLNGTLIGWKVYLRSEIGRNWSIVTAEGSNQQ